MAGAKPGREGQAASPKGNERGAPATRKATRKATRNKQAGSPKPSRAATEPDGLLDASPIEAHEWVSFEDPEEDRTWQFDVTFLCSHWQCIYGQGCQGVLTGPAPELEQGCCSYGAHFTGPADAARVERAAANLSEDQWQFAKRAARSGPLRRGRNGSVKTRMVAGACIFLNRPGFPGGAGCALHRAALERGLLPLQLKPDVCWQLPLRREENVDDHGHVTSWITQWDRRHWGDGGAEFHWWCTEAPEAFRGARPVYQALGAELIAMIGPEVYATLVRYLEKRQQRGVPLPHPTLRRSR